MTKCLIPFVRGHQRFLSSLKVRTHYVHTPTCSQYATEALKKYGTLKDIWLACKRILRYHPFAEDSYDPAP